MGFEWSNREIANLSLAALGGTTIADTSLHTGSWFAFTVIEAATFTTITDEGDDGSGATSITYESGTIFGQFTALQLSGGAIKAYKSE